MYATYIHYRPESGEIIGWVSDHTAPTEPGFMLSPTGGPVDGEKFYVSNGAVVQRPGNPARLRGQRLTGLPVPSRIFINWKPYDCSEPDVTLEFTYPGTYRVRVQAFPHQDMEFEVTQ